MVNIDYVAIGNRIKQKRKELDLTQKQLASRVNLSEGSISKYENGKVEDATNTKLNEFASVLGVPIAWLLGIEIELKQYKNILNLSDEEKHYIEVYRSLDLEGRNFINHAFDTASVMYKGHITAPEEREA